MRRFKVLVSVLALCALAACVNMGLTFLLETHGSQSQLMWRDYQQQEQMDTVIAGSSLAQRSVDPRILDEVDGYVSFNTGTPLQGIEETFVTIQTANEDHHIKRVILQIGYSVLQDADGPDPGSTFLVQRSRAVSAQQALATLGWCLFDQGAWKEATSINWVFPWIANHVKLNPKAISRNVKAKVDNISLEDGSKLLSRKFRYFAKGYGAEHFTFDVNNAIFRTFGNKESEDKDFVDARMQTLEQICAYCQQNGIELVAFATPLPAYSILDYGERYFEQKAQLDELFGRYGVDYLDFTLISPDIFETKDSLYADYEHLNDEGAGVFTKVLADVLKKRDAGQDVSGLFLNEQQYWASLHGVYAVDMESERVGSDIQLQARALAGADAKVEYQFCVKKAAKKAQRGKVRKTSAKGWKVVRKFSSDPACAVQFDKRGKYTVRVNVREQGTKKRYDLYRELDIMY